jgi:hypothetical protein
LVSRIAVIDVQTCDTPEEAVELERILLLAHRPPFNRAGVWQGNPWWLRVATQKGRLHLDLNQIQNGLGPLPPAFRYVFGTLVRCLYRIDFPSQAIADYPHGHCGVVVPRTLAMALPDLGESAAMITAYVEKTAAPLLTAIESLPPAPGWEDEYWMEEFERLKNMRRKLTTPREACPVSLKRVIAETSAFSNIPLRTKSDPLETARMKSARCIEQREKDSDDGARPEDFSLKGSVLIRRFAPC